MFRDPKLPKALLPSYERGVEEVKSLVAPCRVVTVDHEGAERGEREPGVFPACG